MAMLESKGFLVWFCAVLVVSITFYAGALKAQEKSESGAVAILPFGVQSLTDADYRIVAGDVVRIEVWKYPDISRTIPVNRDGKITLPLVRVMKASGLSAMELAGIIRRRLEGMVDNPQVTVIVVETRSMNYTPKMEPLRPNAIPPARSPQFRDTPSPAPHLDGGAVPQGIRPAQQRRHDFFDPARA
jgi:hypothetical protein